MQEGPVFKKASRAPAALLKKARKRKALLYALAAGFFAADWAALRAESFFFPSVKGRTASKTALAETESRLENRRYKMIWENNIFHTGPIPERLFAEKIQPSDPVKTSLPFVLKGTIVHADPHRSIATVKGRKGSRAYSVGNVIEDQAEITQIEKRRIVFLNKQSGLSEFLETVERSVASSVGRRLPAIKKLRVTKPALVKKLSGGSRQVRRSDLQQYLQPEKLHEVLRQARMVPNNRINEDGEMSIEGFRFASIKSGSVYEELGFKVGDIISEVEGEKVNSIDKAGELFHRFKTSGRLQMKVNGELRTYTVEEDAPIN